MTMCAEISTETGITVLLAPCRPTEMAPTDILVCFILSTPTFNQFAVYKVGISSLTQGSEQEKLEVFVQLNTLKPLTAVKFYKIRRE